MEDKKQTVEKGGNGLRPYLTALAAWALAFGSCVGWGAFVMPGNIFLSVAGPAGSVIGMFLGAAAILVIGYNYHYLMNRYPDSGGTFIYTKEEFGYDHGFMAAWFLGLVYLVIIWAYITVIPLTISCIFGNYLKFGLLYTVAGDGVYLGEVIAEILAIFIMGAVCLFRKRIASVIQVVFALILFLGIFVCALSVFHKSGGIGTAFSPPFHSGSSEIIQILSIISLAPWSFVGFESVSNSTPEFRFNRKKSFKIITFAILAGFLSYVFLILSSSSLYPDGFRSWQDYIDSLGQVEGLGSLPILYAVNQSMGRTGLLFIALVAIAGIVTGIIGNSIASSRLVYSLARERIIPERFSALNADGIPRNAILLISCLCLPIPFLGRMAMSWIVNLNIVGATIAYGYTCASARKAANREKAGLPKVMAVIGLIISCFFGLCIMIPNFWTISNLGAESYIILAFWSILGFIIFRIVLRRDRENRFGKTVLVWVALIFLILLTSVMWMRQTMHTETVDTLSDIRKYYDQKVEEHGLERTDEQRRDEAAFLGEEMDAFQSRLFINSTVQLFLVLISLFLMFRIYSMMKNKEKQTEYEKVRAIEGSRAKSIFLSNMSHDIRTPMNAIVGYTTLAKGSDVTMDEMRGYLDKIEGSSRHLLSLINDVLEMSRIESGKLELMPEAADLKIIMDEIWDMFQAQMKGKGIIYSVRTENLVHRAVLCDKNRLNRILLNLIGNSYKFTPENGAISVLLREEPSKDPKKGQYELIIKDNGIGMSEEFASRVFEAFERERSSTVDKIQGTGLGMAITKNFVDLMGGEISLVTAPDEGTEFRIRLEFSLADEGSIKDTESLKAEAEEINFKNRRLLLVEDMLVNRELATIILKKLGFLTETAENGKEALDMVNSSEAGYYDAVLMDIQMPVMDGYEAARAIRSITDSEKARVPIIAMTANAFSEDVEKALDAGMNGHVSKPVDVNELVKKLKEVLGTVEQ